MAHYSDFKFGELSRIGTDSCCLDQRTLQDRMTCSYLLENYFLQDGCMTKAVAFATSQPFINYSGSHGMGVGGCNVDDSSKLLIGGTQTNPKARIDLFHRPYATVPYLGRGSVDPILEYQIQQGEGVSSKKTVTKLTEKNYMKHCTTPLIPEVRQNIQNPNRLIESDAAKYWIRGGVPSRELTRDKDFSTMTK
jgi:hypothetical protein